MELGNVRVFQGPVHSLRVRFVLATTARRLGSRGFFGSVGPAKDTSQSLGPPVVPFVDYRKKGYPYSILSTGGPRSKPGNWRLVRGKPELVAAAF